MGRRSLPPRHPTESSGPSSSSSSGKMILPEGKAYIQTRPAAAKPDDGPETPEGTTTEASHPNEAPPLVPSATKISTVGRSQSVGALDTSTTSAAARRREERIRKFQSQKRVSFSKLEIRSYEVVPGDHLWCSEGCSVSLGWDYCEHGPCTVDHYEASRSPRRSLTEMRMTAEERKDRLTGNGCTETDLRRVSRKLYRARSCVARLGNRTHDKFFHG